MTAGRGTGEGSAALEAEDGSMLTPTALEAEVDGSTRTPAAALEAEDGSRPFSDPESFGICPPHAWLERRTGAGGGQVCSSMEDWGIADDGGGAGGQRDSLLVNYVDVLDRRSLFHVVCTKL